MLQNRLRSFHSNRGFTLVELMIVVAIIGIIAAISIPAYQRYVRRSYANEVTTGIANIKAAEEAWFSINNCYVDAAAWPGTQPVNGRTEPWDPRNNNFSDLDVRPDRRVRFQYQVWASDAINVARTGCAGGAGSGAAKARPPAATIQCGGDTGTTLIPAAIFPNNWYVIRARGDLDGDGIFSYFVSAIDDSTIIRCAEDE